MPQTFQTVRPRRMAGFTWIELIMVIAVIGLLAMMAIPGLQEATLKRQVKDGMALASVATKGVQDAWSAKGEMPADNAAAGVPPSAKIIGNLVKDVNVEGGAVTLTFGNNAAKGLHDKHLTLRPAVVPGEAAVPIAWICAGVSVPAGMELRGTDRTDIQASWLPVDCRGRDTK
jgi:type IV pilus assembly protein PilA